jgi:hypothetical protein
LPVVVEVVELAEDPSKCWRIIAELELDPKLIAVPKEESLLKFVVGATPIFVFEAEKDTGIFPRASSFSGLG